MLKGERVTLRAARREDLPLIAEYEGVVLERRAHVWSNGAYDDLVLMGVLRDED